jgi:hypothetical protein
MVEAVVEAVDVEAIRVVVKVNHLLAVLTYAIANAMTSEERKRHMEEGLCFKCHKKGH